MRGLLEPAEMLAHELTERQEPGHDVESLEEGRGALDGGSSEEIERTHALVEATPLRADLPYEEPSTLDEIRGTRGAANYYSLEWSPDGRLLVMSRFNIYRCAEIYVMDALFRDIRRLAAIARATPAPRGRQTGAGSPSRAVGTRRRMTGTRRRSA